MLACDSAVNGFNSRGSQSFTRYFRTDPYPEPRDLSHYRKMYTEGELKDKDRKRNSPPPSHPSPVAQSLTHGFEAPLQPSPEVLPPASAAHAPSSTSTPMESPTAAFASTTTTTSPQPGAPKGDAHPAHHHQHSSSHQHYHPYADTDHQGNSDSDSSGAYGPDGNRRYREFVPDEQKDMHYWEKRRKNNEAARKSREKRRIHDKILEGRINCLEDDNTKLRRELLALKKKFNLPDGHPSLAGVLMDDEPVHQRGGNVSPPPSSNNSQVSRNSPVGGVSKAPAPAHMPYSSPPPLLSVAGAIQMGVAMYSNNAAGVPYFMSDASRLGQDSMMKSQPSAISTGHPHHPLSQHHHSVHHSAYPADLLKHEPIEEGEVRTRERSNSNQERRATYQLEPPETSLLRRGSVGNYPQYRSPMSPTLVGQSPFTSAHVNHLSQAPYLQRSYDSYSHSSWSQRSPVSSHSSDENYDEPLQLTVRRDSNVSAHSNNAHDDSSMESEQSVTQEKIPSSISPPASSFPLKLRHKLPMHDVSYPKDLFPSMASAAVAVTPSSFSPHPFMNGLA
ncbi:unnamed protein product, partial [Lymnaea stagnalis]